MSHQQNWSKFGGVAITSRTALCALLLLLGAACQVSRPPIPTATEAAPPTQVEPDIVNLPGRGVEIDGRGDTLTDPITPNYAQGITVGISRVTATHDGQSAFTVQAITNNQPTVLVATTGQYSGSRPFVVVDAVAFQVKADGKWTIRVEPLRPGGQPAFSGTGDSLGSSFQPPPPGQWLISGQGTKLWVDLHCLSGDVVVVDTSGPLRNTATINFSTGPCFWEVQSDGAWSLQPQP
jgi:hypothetical protein